MSAILSHPGVDPNVVEQVRCCELAGRYCGLPSMPTCLQVPGGSGGPTPFYNAAAGGHSRVAALLLKDARVDPSIIGGVRTHGVIVDAVCRTHLLSYVSRSTR